MYSRPALATRRDSTRLDWAVQTSPPSTVRGAAPRPSMARCVHGTSHHRSSSKPCEHDRPDQRARGQPVLYGPAHHRLFELPSGAVSSPVCTSGDLRARARAWGGTNEPMWPQLVHELVPRGPGVAHRHAQAQRALSQKKTRDRDQGQGVFSGFRISPSSNRMRRTSTSDCNIRDS